MCIMLLISCKLFGHSVYLSPKKNSKAGEHNMKINRIQKIRELLEDNHSISINTLCDTFNVSKYTIRRDINELEKTGFLKKVYGGIVLQEQEHNSPEPFSLRESRNVQAKKKIAHIAASQVQDGDIRFRYHYNAYASFPGKAPTSDYRYSQCICH